LSPAVGAPWARPMALALSIRHFFQPRSAGVTVEKGPCDRDSPEGSPCNCLPFNSFHPAGICWRCPTCGSDRGFKAAEPRRLCVRGAGARDRDDPVVRRRPARAPACGGTDGPGEGGLPRPPRRPVDPPAVAGERSERKPGRTRRAAAPPLSTSDSQRQVRVNRPGTGERRGRSYAPFRGWDYRFHTHGGAALRRGLLSGAPSGGW